MIVAVQETDFPFDVSFEEEHASHPAVIQRTTDRLDRTFVSEARNFLSGESLPHSVYQPLITAKITLI